MKTNRHLEHLLAMNQVNEPNERWGHSKSSDGFGFPSISTLISKLEFSSTSSILGGGHMNSGMPIQGLMQIVDMLKYQLLRVLLGDVVHNSRYSLSHDIILKF